MSKRTVRILLAPIVYPVVAALALATLGVIVGIPGLFLVGWPIWAALDHDWTFFGIYVGCELAIIIAVLALWAWDIDPSGGAR